MSEETIVPFFSPKNIFTTEVRGTQHTYYLTGVIGPPENYVELCNILRSSGPQDEVVIRINSRGGSVASERMIVNAIEESEANVVAFIEYDCMSAATGVFLAAHKHGWARHIQFMAHCAWWGAIGKNPDIKSQTEFGLKQMEEEIGDTYTGLLTEEEISLCNDGKEFWFGAKELEERMERFYEYRASQPCNDPTCTECGSEGEGEEANLSFDEMLDEIATKAAEQTLKKIQSKFNLAPKEKKPSAKTQKALDQAKEIRDTVENLETKLNQD